jgi:hypothetical protein
MNRATVNRATVSQGGVRDDRGVDPEIVIRVHPDGSEKVDAKDRETHESTIADTGRETLT